MSSSTKVGLIGTGIMGEPMAANILAAGFPLTVNTRTKSRADRLIANGAAWAETPAHLAQACDIIISIVPDTPDVEAVYYGGEGVIAGIRPNCVAIDMSTIAPAVAEKIARALTDKQCAFLDAPVSGGKTGAEAGKLSIMVGGEADAIERARPVLEAMGKRIVHCGPSGHGQYTKLCNQIIVVLNLLAVSEALAFAKKAGLNAEKMLEAVSAGAAGSWAVDNLGPRMLARDFEPMFMIDLQQKDLRIALAAAQQTQTSLPGTSLVHQLLAANQAAGEGRKGTQALVKVLERLAGIEV
ncbi:MAG: NAD(P)-dependent oxidoreductase [Alphaproteobacteria bacterium]